MVEFTRKLAGPDHAVDTVEGTPFRYMRKPCQECPWRLDSRIGEFPTEAYRISANTAEDMASHTFACHMAGKEHGSTCAGFLLRNADSNLSVRLAMFRGDYDPRKINDGGAELFESYRAMAEANGVSADDPALAKCRSNND
jgi:hypothetical protein